MQYLVKLFILFLGCIGLPAHAEKPFDYYVLSLSWSPEFCAIKPEDRQCGRGYGIVLHGLWPQYDKGYPQNCGFERLSKTLVNRYRDLYPSPKLLFHEWNKHGSCSALPPADYLELSRTLKDNFKTPAALQVLSQPLRVTAVQLKQHIIAANPKLTTDALAFACTGGGRFLQEIYICFDQTGATATTCSAEVQKRSQKSCGQSDFLMRNVR